MASLGEKSSDGKTPQQEEATATELKKDQRRKTKMIRMTQAQIDYCIAVHKSSPPMVTEEGLPKFTDALSPEQLAGVSPRQLEWMLKMDAGREERIARSARLDREVRQEREDIIRQYRTKGYVEVEVYDDSEEDEEKKEKRPHHGRRRFRPVPVKQSARAPLIIPSYNPVFTRRPRSTIAPAAASK